MGKIYEEQEITRVCTVHISGPSTLSAFLVKTPPSLLYLILKD